MPDISIVIVNFNTKLLLKNCIKSILRNHDSYSVEIIVVDNASNDNSSQMVKSVFPKVKLIRNRRNFLFSKAYNQGINRATGKYVLILNSDTELMKNTLKKMYKFMDNNKECGMSSCRQIDKSGKTIPTCQRYPTPLAETSEFPIFKKIVGETDISARVKYKGWDRKTTREVDAIPGSFMFVRRLFLRRIGYFDNKLSLFYNDVDLSMRFKKRGYKIFFLGNTVIKHFSAQSIKKLPRLEVIKQAYRDMYQFYKKHFGVVTASLLYLMALPNLIYYALNETKNTLR